MPDTPPPSIGRRTGRMGADGASLHRHDDVRHAPSGSDQDAAARVPVGQGRDSALRESGVGEFNAIQLITPPCLWPPGPQVALGSPLKKSTNHASLESSASVDADQ